MPVKEVVTMELPTRRIEMTSSVSSGPSTNEVKVPPSPAIKVTIRKIPVSIHHNGKVQNFAIAESKTVVELFNEIRRLSNCKAPFVVPSFSSNVSESASLKSLSIDTSNLFGTLE